MIDLFEINVLIVTEKIFFSLSVAFGKVNKISVRQRQKGTFMAYLKAAIINIII